MKVYFTSSLLTLLAAAFSNGNVVINEIAYRGSGDDTCDGEDWIELLNSGVDAVDLTNYVLHNDKGADDEDAAILSSGIGPGEILLLCKDTDFEFGIANSDTMNLVDPTGTLVDFMPLPGTGSDKETYNLVIDTNTSDSTYSYSTTQTPGTPNVITVGLPLEEKPRSQNEEGADFFLDNEDSEFDDIAPGEEGHSVLYDHSNLASSERFLRPKVKSSKDTKDTKKSNKFEALSETEVKESKDKESKDKASKHMKKRNKSTSPSEVPLESPSDSPSAAPSTSPSLERSGNPSASPSDAPTNSPTTSPSKRPTNSPTTSPSKRPTNSPTTSPSKRPTLTPTPLPPIIFPGCTTSSECSTGFCAIRKLTGNVCESDCQPYGCIETAPDGSLDNGAICMRSSQCKSGRCSSSSDDMSHTCAERCGAYGCEDIGKTELDLGEGCKVNSQCKSLKCASGLCSNFCYGTCPGLTSIKRPGDKSNGKDCEEGDECSSGYCCYTFLASNTCEDECKTATTAVIAGEDKPNDSRCSDNVHCRSRRCSQALPLPFFPTPNTCESECGSLGCVGAIVGVDLPIDATCEVSTQCTSGFCSTDIFGRNTCESECGLFACEGVIGVGGPCIRDGDCDTGRCAWDVDISEPFQFGKCREKLADGDPCPLVEFEACVGDLSCAGFPGNSYCANYSNIDFARGFATVITNEFYRIQNALAYFGDILGQLEFPTSNEFDNSPYPLNIDVNSLEIDQFRDEIDDLVGFILASSSYQQQRRRLGAEDDFQIKVFANLDYASIASFVNEVGIVLSFGQDGNVNIGVYISSARGIGLDVLGDAGFGVAFVFDSIETVGGNNGCIYLEASYEFGLGLTYCGIQYLDGIKGPPEIIVAPAVGISFGVGYLKRRTFLAACTFGEGGDDGKVVRGCLTSVPSS